MAQVGDNPGYNVFQPGLEKLMEPPEPLYPGVLVPLRPTVEIELVEPAGGIWHVLSLLVAQ